MWFNRVNRIVFWKKYKKTQKKNSKIDENCWIWKKNEKKCCRWRYMTWMKCAKTQKRNLKSDENCWTWLICEKRCDWWKRIWCFLLLMMMMNFFCSTNQTIKKMNVDMSCLIENILMFDNMILQCCQFKWCQTKIYYEWFSSMCW